MTHPAVVVMVKAPTPGTVKTRLSPPLSPADAASLAAAFAQDTVAGLRQNAPVLAAYAPVDKRAVLESLLPPGLLWTAQRGQNLGARLDAALADAHAHGFGPLLVVGTDSPTLPPAFALDAFSVLHTGQADVVLGPTDDGGYYLVGLRQPAPGLFDAVAWSTPRAYADTAANAARLGLRLHALPPWYDIDTADDLARLRREMEADPAARVRAPMTAHWLHCFPEPALSPL